MLRTKNLGNVPYGHEALYPTAEARRFYGFFYKTLMFKHTLTDIPSKIKSEQEYQDILAVAEFLTFKCDRTPQEDELYRRLVLLIESFEEGDPRPVETPPHKILQHIMESSGTTESELSEAFESHVLVSDLLSGKQSVSKKQAEILSNMFRVSADLFLRPSFSRK